MPERRPAMPSKARKAKLLPCPFDGGTDVGIERDEDGFYRVRCGDCGASTNWHELDVGGDSRRRAIAAWNRRSK